MQFECSSGVREGSERGNEDERKRRRKKQKKGNHRKSVLLVSGHVDIPTATTTRSMQTREGLNSGASRRNKRIKRVTCPKHWRDERRRVGGKRSNMCMCM